MLKLTKRGLMIMLKTPNMTNEKWTKIVSMANDESNLWLIRHAWKK